MTRHLHKEAGADLEEHHRERCQQETANDMNLTITATKETHPNVADTNRNAAKKSHPNDTDETHQNIADINHPNVADTNLNDVNKRAHHHVASSTVHMSHPKCQTTNRDQGPNIKHHQDHIRHISTNPNSHSTTRRACQIQTSFVTPY